LKMCAITTWPPHQDGISFYSAQLYDHIGRRIEVKVLANIINFTKRDSEVGNCKIVRCWRRGSIAYPFKIFREIMMEKPDVIHLQHGWFLYGDKISPLLFPLLLFILRLTRKPLIVTMHTVIGWKPRLYENAILNFIARVIILLLTRSIVNLSDKIIVHNNLMKRALIDFYSLHRDHWKIFVIPHGVKEKAKKCRGVSKEEGIKILSLGFLRKQKGIEYLIEAFKIFSTQYPKSTLIIVGGKHAHDDGEYIKLLKRRLLYENVKNVIFTGFIDEETLDKLIWESKIIVLPSLGSYYFEASGSLARVAMYGKPIVCSKVPKFKADLEDGKDCVMVEFNNPKKLADVLFLLVSDVNFRRKIGKNLGKKFRDRVWDKVAEQHINLFRDALIKN